MAEIDFTEIADTSIATPATGVAALSVGPDHALRVKDSTGFRRSLVSNFSAAVQTPVAATRTYLAGSAITIPAGKLQIGTCFRWSFNMTKTAAGVAASTIDIAVGTAGTVADTARVSFTKPAGTAVADEGRVVIECICAGPLSAAGVFKGHFNMSHNLQTTGHMTTPGADIEVASAGFDVTVASLIVGICLTTGASDVITIQRMFAEAWNL